MSRKVLWHGKFNYQGEIHNIYCKANNTNHAFSTMCVQLARKLKVSSWSVRQYFWATDKYEIKLINKSETSKNDASEKE